MWVNSKLFAILLINIILELLTSITMANDDNNSTIILIIYGEKICSNFFRINFTKFVLFFEK